MREDFSPAASDTDAPVPGGVLGAGGVVASPSVLLLTTVVLVGLVIGPPGGRLI